MTSRIIASDGRTFEMTREKIEVTSTHRPDEGWQFIDASGHVHQWEWPDGRRVYRPDQRATLPTMQWVVTGTGYWEDGEPYDIGEYRCQICAVVVEPGYRADDHRQFIAGLTYCSIDGEPVSPDVFEREFERAAAASQ